MAFQMEIHDEFPVPRGSDRIWWDRLRIGVSFFASFTFFHSSLNFQLNIVLQHDDGLPAPRTAVRLSPVQRLSSIAGNY